MKKITLSEIEEILYRGTPGGKPEDVEKADKIIDYVRLAYEGKLEEVPEEYREFAQLSKNHWQEMRRLSHGNQKMYLQKQIHGLLEAQN